MKFEINDIENLIKLMDKGNLCELTLEDGERAVMLKRASGDKVENVQICAPQIEETKTIEAPEEETEGHLITSPMVGTFYAASSPNAQPFARVGDTVKEGQVVCIVEAMKLMNEIESDFSGKVVKICVKDGEAVEYGQTLMIVK